MLTPMTGIARRSTRGQLELDEYETYLPYLASLLNFG